MKRFIPVLGLILSRVSPVAAEPGAEPFHFVVSHGQITAPVASPEPASLKNAIAIINQHYPRSTVAMVAVDDVMLPDIAIDWPRAGPDPRAVLRVLSEASHFVFQTDSNQAPSFYVVSPNYGEPRQDMQVFNLKNYLQPGADGLRVQLRNAKAQLRVWSERYEDKHPKIQDLKSQIAETDMLLKEVIGTDEEATQKVKQITDLITESVAECVPDSAAPRYFFHRELSLLVVIGDQRSVDAAKKVVAALQ